MFNLHRLHVAITNANSIPVFTQVVEARLVERFRVFIAVFGFETVVSQAAMITGTVFPHSVRTRVSPTVK